MYRIGVDLGGTNISVGVVDDDRLVEKYSISDEAEAKQKQIRRDLPKKFLKT